MIKNLLTLIIAVLFYGVALSQSNNLDSISIIGSSTVCQGVKFQYTTTKFGGYWTSSDRNIARIDTVSGWLSAVNPGVVTINYLEKSSNTIISTKQITILSSQPIQLSVVNNLVCVGSNININTNSPSTGVWSSSDPTIASVGNNGNITGLSIGSATIKYLSKFNGTCSDSVSTLKIQVINSFPDSNVILGNNKICSNSLVQYSSKFPYSYSLTSDSTIVSVSGNSAFSHNPGKATISFNLNASGSCPSKTVNFNVEVYQNPAKIEIKGENILCSNCNGYLKTSFVGYRGVWSSNNTSKITVDSSGRVKTLGVDTATIYYNLPATSECPSYSNSFKIKSVNTNDFLKLSGYQYVDLDKSVFFKSSSPLRMKNYWYSCDSTIATVNSSTGQVTGKNPGYTTILYRSGTGSFDDTVSTRTIQVFTPADAGIISGNKNICIGSTTQLVSTNLRGTWSSSNLNIIQVTTSGLVTGLKSGTETVFYKIIDPNGVNDSISSISITVQENLIIHVTNRVGIDRVCVGDTAYLNANLSGGTWTSQNSDIASIEFYNRASTKNEGNVLINYKLNKSSFCKDSIATKKLNVVLPKVNLTTSNVVINGFKSDTVVLRASILNDSVKQNAITYYWKINGSTFTTNTAFYKTRAVKSYDTLSVYYQTNYSTSNICSQNKTIVSNKIVFNKDSSVIKSSACDIIAFSLIKPSVTATFIGTSIALTVPAGTNVTNLIANFSISPKATVKVGTLIQVSGQTANDFTNPVIYTVTAEDGSSKQYVVNVTVVTSSEKDILVCKSMDPSIEVNVYADQIKVTIPEGYTDKQLGFTFESSPYSKVKFNNNDVSGTFYFQYQNSSQQYELLVTAEDGTTKKYILFTVEYLPSITSINCDSIQVQIIDSSGTYRATRDAYLKSASSAKLIYATLPSYSDTLLVGREISSIINAAIGYTGGNGRPFIERTIISSGVTGLKATLKAGNLANGNGTLFYQITGKPENAGVANFAIDFGGQSCNFSITVIENTAKSSACDLLSFKFISPAVIGKISGSSIYLTVPAGTNVSNLVASFTVSSYASVNVGTNIQVSGQTPNNFSDTVRYTVTAEDGIIKNYYVIVNVQQIIKSSACEITSFGFSNPAVNGTISGNNIALTVPAGTNVTNMIANFTISPKATVKVGSVNQVSGQTGNNFTNSVVYTVTAEDGVTMKSYVVSVNLNQIVPPSSNTIIDTSKFIEYKKTYGNPSNYINSSNNIGYKLKGYPARSPETGTDYLSLYQTFNSQTEVKWKGVGVVLRSLNTASADVDVTFYGKKSMGGKSEVLGTVSKNIVFNAVANNGYAVNYFVLPDAVTVPDTFMINIAPHTDKDSIQVLTTGYYGRTTSATASISGTTLTATAFSNTGFSVGQIISGTGVIEGTKITAQTSATTYTVDKAQTVASTTITSPTLTYGVVGGTLGVRNVPTSGNPTDAMYELFWNPTANKAYETDVYSYPIVEYNWNSTPTVDNKCLGTNKNVTVNFSNEKLIKNPLFNRAAFDLTYRGKTKADNAFYATIGYAKDKTSDNVDNATANYAITKTYASDVYNDTVNITEYLITYNKLASVYLKTRKTSFLISGKLSATTSVTNASLTNTYGQVSAQVTGGYAPYSYSWNNNAFTTNPITVTEGRYFADISDYNGCKITTDSVTVLKIMGTEKEILSYSINNIQAKINGTSISITLPYGTDLTKLTASFTTTNAKVKVNGVEQVSGQTANDFTLPLIYTVIAEDSSSLNYTVTVEISPKSSACEITSFGFTNPAVKGTISGTNIWVTVPFGTNITSLIPAFVVSNGATVKVNGISQISGTTPNDFTSAVYYEVTAEDGVTKNTVTVKVNVAQSTKSSAKDILSFGFTNPSVVGTITNSDIALTVPAGTNVTNLIANFSVSPYATVKVGTTTQVSGQTANNFTSQVMYVVTAEDGSNKIYYVQVAFTSATASVSSLRCDTVEVQNLNANYLQLPSGSYNPSRNGYTAATKGIDYLMLAYDTLYVADSIRGLNLLISYYGGNGGAYGYQSISSIENNGINLLLQPGTLAVGKGKLTFKIYGETRKVRNASFNVNIGGKTCLVKFNIKDTSKYTVIQSSAKDITAFSFVNPTVTGVISGTTISLSVPFGTNITNLIANFTISPKATIKVGTILQVSGFTANNFTSPISYVVTAEDGTTKNYVVEVTVSSAPKSSANDFISFSLSNPSVIGKIYTVNMGINLLVPAGADLTKAIINFTVSPGATLYVNNVKQVSGLSTINLSPVYYDVVAEDGTKKSYKLYINYDRAIISGQRTLCVNASSQLTASSQGSLTQKNWAMSDTSIAKITPNGVVTAIKPGQSVVSFYSINEVKTVDTIYVLPTSITSAGSITGKSDMCMGEVVAFSVTNQGGTWSSSDTTIATIDGKSGQLTAKSDGQSLVSYTIPGTSMCNLSVSNFKIVVHAPLDVLPIEGVTTFCKNSSTNLSSQTNLGTWESNNTSVASVDANGKVSGLAAGTSKITYTVSQNGCTSATTTNVEIIDLPSIPAITGNTKICNGSSAQLSNALKGGVWLTNDSSVVMIDSNGVMTPVKAGVSEIIYRVTENGCTSYRTIVAYVKNASTSTETKTACTSYTWNNQTYTQSGVYTYTTNNKVGCDSVVTLNLTIDSVLTQTEKQTACGEYTWHGTTYKQSGTYVDTLKTSGGCDSIVTLYLTISPKVAVTETKVSCGAYTWHGKTYTQSGIYVDTMKTQAGCDSIVTLNLTIKSVSTSTASVAACGSYVWNKQTYLKSGIYTHATKTLEGCDSIAILNLTMGNGVSVTETKTACASFTWHGKTYTQSGTYVDSLKTPTGCDSIVTLNLKLQQAVQVKESKITCGAYTWHGKTYTQSGTYVDSLKTQGGCDSLVTLDLTIAPVLYGTETKVTCNDFTWHGKTYNKSGTYVDSLKTTAGCDSVVTLKLQITPVVTFTETKVTCSAYTWHGKTYAQSGTYVDTMNTKAGCDSIVTLNLTIKSVSTSTENIAACGSYVWNKQTYAKSGIYTYPTKTLEGCDSIAILNLTIHTGVSSILTKTACGSLTWNGKTLNQSGTYVDSLKTIIGCDSVVTLKLTINQGVTATESKTACGLLVWHGKTFTQSGTYVDTLQTSLGCDSIVTLNLTVNPIPAIPSILGDTSITVGSTSPLTVATISGIWSSLDASIAEVTAQGVVTGVKVGTTLIRYEVTANGCMNAKTIQVVVAKIDTATTGLQTVYASGMEVFPNPFVDKVHITLDQVGDYQIQVYDLTGKLLTDTRHENTKEIIVNLEHIASGEYVLKVIHDQFVQTRKLTK